MGTGRDEFAKDTIRKAAGRVGYRCSFPGCPNSTIGASMEKANKTSVTGVAAHICAAAEGGPRYDKNMSAEERRSVENCIWLCQTHSKLIDTDVQTYTAEVLRQWKADAEVGASKALANGDYFAEYYKSNGENLDILKQLFDDMIVEGQFDQLRIMLDQYKTVLSEQYEEFVLRYKIVHDTYCNRDQLKNHLDAYCNLVSKSGVDTLIELFLSFHLVEELSRIIGFCLSEPLARFANLALTDELTKLLIAPVGSSQTIEIPAELNDVIQKYITNHIVKNRIVGAIDVTGAKYAVFSDEFYYRAIAAVYELSCAKIYGKGNFQDIIVGSDCLFIKNNIDKIAILDITLQEYIWGQFLAFLSEDSVQFETYYEQCPLPIRGKPSIEKAYYVCKITHKVKQIDIPELMDYVSRTGEAAVLCAYLSSIDKNAAVEFLDEHGYLYKQNSAYLKLRLDLQIDIQPEDANAFLEKYTEVYADDFTFHLLLVKYAVSDENVNAEFEWLRANKYELKPHDAVEYMQILCKYHRWLDLVELSQNKLPNELAFAIAGYLTESKDDNHIKISCELYQNLVNIGWLRKGLHYNLGVIQKHFGRFEEAKASFQKEYDLYANTTSLMALIQLRYSLNEYLTDEYFDHIKRCIDPYSQNLVAAIYMKCCNYADARKHFLRSLLLKDNDNLSINGFYQTTSHLPSEAVNKVGANVFCVLKNDDHTCNIAIHEDGIMEGIITPKSFAGYMHYSVQDTEISSLLFAAQGDLVTLGKETFKVTEVMSANDAINRFLFSTLSTREGVTVIRSSSPEDFRDQMSAILKKSSEDLNKRIDEYNKLEIRSPLSLLAVATGKGRLKTCEFLAFQNQKKVRNNPAKANPVNDTPTFVLSYEAIVYLAHLEIDNIKLTDLNMACSYQVRNQLLNDINEELSELSDDSQKGTMFYENGKLALLERTPDMRRARYSFLTRLKLFVNSLQVISNLPIFSLCNTELKDSIDNLFSEKAMYCECTSLAAARNTHNGILVSDDQFLYALANAEGIRNIGLTGLLSQSNLSWKELLSASKKLKDMNYGNYFPVHLYKQIVDQMLACETELDKASVEIQEWIVSDTEGDATQHHEDVIITLFREVVKQGLDYLNPENFLMDVALNIWEKRNPGFIQKCVTEAFESLKGE